MFIILIYIKLALYWKRKIYILINLTYSTILAYFNGFSYFPSNYQNLSKNLIPLINLSFYIFILDELINIQ